MNAIKVEGVKSNAIMPLVSVISEQVPAEDNNTDSTAGDSGSTASTASGKGALLTHPTINPVKRDRVVIDAKAQSLLI